jgi:hypothetical protein
MITKVQSGYYILPSVPFFVISIAILIHPLIESFLVKFAAKHPLYLKAAGMALIVSGIVLTDFFAGKPNRDKELISDMKLITSVVPDNAVIGILPDMSAQWSLHCYFARFHGISLDAVAENNHEFLIIDRNISPDPLNRSYKKTELATMRFDLYKLGTPEQSGQKTVK